MFRGLAERCSVLACGDKAVGMVMEKPVPATGEMPCIVMMLLSVHWRPVFQVVVQLTTCWAETG